MRAGECDWKREIRAAFGAAPENLGSSLCFCAHRLFERRSPPAPGRAACGQTIHMSRLVLATGNSGKIKEIEQILEGAYDEIVTAEDLGIDMSQIEEDADTFEGNAEKKAVAVSLKVDGDVLADDSGLEVPVLGGAPGVRSARFAGDNADDAANNAKLLELLKGKKDRKARFVCCMVIANGGIVKHVVEGHVGGELLETPRGKNGFGYDPLFFYPEGDMTFAELPMEKKNEVSHRANALRKLKEAVSANG